MLTHSNIYHPASGSLSSAGSVSAMNVTGENRTWHCSFKVQCTYRWMCKLRLWYPSPPPPLETYCWHLGAEKFVSQPWGFLWIPFSHWCRHFSRRAQRNWAGLPGLIPMSPSPVFISCLDEDVEWFVLSHHIKDRNQTLKILQIYPKAQLTL